MVSETRTPESRQVLSRIEGTVRNPGGLKSGLCHFPEVHPIFNQQVRDPIRTIVAYVPHPAEEMKQNGFVAENLELRSPFHPVSFGQGLSRSLALIRFCDDDAPIDRLASHDAFARSIIVVF